jgi:drug/metabolite transporter (DMT)-like permease
VSGRPAVWQDVVFDAVQVVAALTAAYFLGFVLQERPYRWQWGAYVGVNIAIAVICGLALVLFGSDDYVEANKPQANLIRKAGLGLAAIGGFSACIALVGPDSWRDDTEAVIFLICLSALLLVILLGHYFWVRVWNRPTASVEPRP